LEPHGNLRYNNEGVNNRKKTQAFREKATGEIFLYSVNHFKAKSGKGSGDNADKGDGQGTFNGDRVREAQSLLNHYESDSYYYGDEDILIMGDLNAYAMEDPITVLREGGMIDLHRAFHADSSYSYVYRGQAGYLDHALCNETLYPHVTGMVAYHINSDESDSYTYDKSNDQSMFRSSDHDPVLVGLRLDTTYTTTPEISVQDVTIGIQNYIPYIYNADGGYYIVYRIDGIKVKEQSISSSKEEINGLHPGMYILNIYGQGKCHKMKIWIK
jgi:predicted extracellular nuclease